MVRRKMVRRKRKAMPDRWLTATFRFTKADDFRIIPVNCVWGGRTPRGDIMVHLCYEGQALPETITHEVTSEGKLGKEIKRDPINVIDRTVLAGMVLTAEQAHSIGKWLLNKASEMNQPAEKKNGDDHDSTGTTH